MKNNKQLVMLIFFAGFGVGSLLVSWFTNQNAEQYITLEERINKVNTNLARFETAFETLTTEIQQLHITVSNNSITDYDNRSLQAINRLSDIDIESTESSADENPLDHNNITTIRGDVPTEQEMASVTLIVDKLRARDMYAYPDLPSLLTSPDATNLSLAAKNQMMAEISRMHENGEIDPSFFSQ